MSFTASLNVSVSLLDFPDNKLEVRGRWGGGAGGEVAQGTETEKRGRQAGTERERCDKINSQKAVNKVTKIQ